MLNKITKINLKFPGLVNVSSIEAPSLVSCRKLHLSTRWCLYAAINLN